MMKPSRALGRVENGSISDGDVVEMVVAEKGASEIVRVHVEEGDQS